jgi:PhnB protein
MNLLYDFTVDKETNTIRITREFAADLDLVWDAFTKPEILDQWQAPKPWRACTKEMDFSEGGRWLYAMISPENVSRWSLAEFTKIQPKSSFSSRNSFCDENGIPTHEAFSLTRNDFKSEEEKTTVYVEKKFDNLSSLEKMVSMGYKQGLAMALANLDEYFLTVLAAK